MPNKVSPYAWIANNGGQNIWSYLPDEEKIMCRICRFACPYSPPSRIKRHLLSPSHIKNVDIYKNHLIHDDIDSSNFNSDLTKMLVSCNIPLAAVDHPNFSKFIEKYAGKKVPSRKTMNKLVNVVSKEVITKVKKEVDGKDLFIAVDETKENRDRSMTAILIGPVDSYFLTRPFLINLTDITIDYANNIADFVIQSIQTTLGEEFDEAKFKVFITDGAPCSKRAGEDLQRLYPQMEHITCVSQGQHNIAELAPNDFPQANEHISELKKMFLKAGQSKRSFISMMEAVHTQTRSRLSVNSLKDLLIIKWNSKFTDL